MFARVHELRKTQWLPMTLPECWDFFSSPANLPVITPPWLGFSIDPIDSGRMYPGQILKYYVTPLFGLRMRWVTEITHVAEPYYFVDEQRFGPYLFWHHQHHFRESRGGVEITDTVHYAVGYWPLDGVIHQLLVRKKVEEIFEHRFRVLEEMFGRRAVEQGVAAVGSV